MSGWAEKHEDVQRRLSRLDKGAYLQIRRQIDSMINRISAQGKYSQALPRLIGYTLDLFPTPEAFSERTAAIEELGCRLATAHANWLYFHGWEDLSKEAVRLHQNQIDYRVEVIPEQGHAEEWSSQESHGLLLTGSQYVVDSPEKVELIPTDQLTRQKSAK